MTDPRALGLGPLMIDIAGQELTAQDRQRLLHPLVGGVILFGRNFASRQQVAALCEQIHQLRQPTLLIAVDHEGGRVQRFTDGFTLLPAMARLGKLWMQDALTATRVATSVGLVLATELRQIGVDFSFTPVLDLDFGSSGVIGDRAFHRDPKVVTMLAKSLNHGLALAGMKNCGKHFPGHGYVKADSHTEVPIDKRPLKAILADDAAPYGWLGSPSLSAVMPAHVIYAKVAPEPAGFSRFWLQTILRDQMAFDGVIFSDDLGMAGASVMGSVDNAARSALEAGCDMVLICHAPDLVDIALASSIPMSAVSARRIERLLPHGPLIDDHTLAQARSDIEQSLQGLA
jgi:beta-N-acetylhexosaminidase